MEMEVEMKSDDGGERFLQMIPLYSRILFRKYAWKKNQMN